MKKACLFLLVLVLPWAGKATDVDSTAIRAGMLDGQLRLARQQQDTLATARALAALGTFHLFETKNDARVLSLARQLLAVATPTHDYLHLARAYEWLAILTFHQKTTNPAPLFNRAVAYARRANNWQVLTEVCQSSADVAIHYKNYARAEELLGQAMTACRTHDPDTWFMAGLDYCALLQTQHRAGAAQALARQLDQMRPRLRKTNGPFVYANDMARLATYLGHYQEAETLLLTGMATEQARPHPTHCTSTIITRT